MIIILIDHGHGSSVTTHLLKLRSRVGCKVPTISPKVGRIRYHKSTSTKGFAQGNGFRSYHMLPYKWHIHIILHPLWALTCGPAQQAAPTASHMQDLTRAAAHCCQDTEKTSKSTERAQSMAFQSALPLNLTALISENRCLYGPFSRAQWGP